MKMEYQYTHVIPQNYEINVLRIYGDSITVFITTMFYMVLMAREQQLHQNHRKNTNQRSSYISHGMCPEECIVASASLCKPSGIKTDQTSNDQTLEHYIRSDKLNNTLEVKSEQQVRINRPDIRPYKIPDYTDNVSSSNHKITNAVSQMPATNISRSTFLIYLFCVENSSYPSIRCSEFRRKTFANINIFLNETALNDHGRVFTTTEQKWETTYVTSYTASQPFINVPGTRHIKHSKSSAFFLVTYCFRKNDTNSENQVEIQCYDIIKEPKPKHPPVPKKLQEICEKELPRLHCCVIDELRNIFGILPKNFDIQQDKTSLPNRIKIPSYILVAAICLACSLIYFLETQDSASFHNRTQTQNGVNSFYVQTQLYNRQRKRRETLIREQKKRARNQFERLMNSLTQSLIQDAGRFEEWLQTPD